MSSFEWYKPRRREPYISIVKYRIGFSSELIREMERPEYVKVGYSDESKSMAIQHCNKDDEHAIKVTGKINPRILTRGLIRYLIDKGVPVEGKVTKYKATWNEVDKLCLVELA